MRLGALIIYAILIVVGFTGYAQSVYELSFSDPTSYSITCGKVNASHWTVSNDSCTLSTTPVFISSACLENDSLLTLPITIRINQSGVFPCDEHAYFDYQSGGIWHPIDTILGCEETANRSYSYNIPIPDSSYFSIRVRYETDDKTRDYQLFDGDIVINDPCSVLLPLTVLAFTGTATDEGISITSRIAPLADHESIELEYSLDGYVFMCLDAMPNQWVAADGWHFQWMHQSPVVPVVYYRLHYFSWEEDHSYSKIIAVKPKTTVAGELLIYPNPASCIVRVRWESPFSADGELMLYNAEQQLQLSKQVSIEGGFNNLTLDVGHLPDGWYNLLLHFGRQQYSAPFILQTF